MGACDNLSVLRIVYFIKQLLSIAFILIPIALIVVITVDFARNVMSDEKTMKDNLRLLLRRFIYTVIIFFVPYIVRFSINHLVDSDVDFMKCYNVDLDVINKQKNLSEEDCKSKGRWNSITNECIIESKTSKNQSSKLLNFNSSSSLLVNSDIKNSIANSSINGESLKSYKNIHKLGEIKLSDPIIVKPVDNSKVGIAQGFCVVNNYFVAMTGNENETKNTLFLYNKKTGKRVKYYNFTGSKFGHANGMTYNSTENNVYVAMAGGRFDDGMHKFFSSNDFNKDKLKITKGKFGNKKNQSIAYDSITNVTYFIQSCGPGGGVSAWDSSKKEVFKPIKRRLRYNIQDIAAYNGLIYAVYYNSSQKSDTSNVKKARNALDIYRVSDGSYLGSYIIKTKEIDTSVAEFESIDYYGSGNTFVFYFNEKKTSKRSYIYTAEINF